MVSGELLLQRLLVVNEYGTVVCNPDLGTRRCKKMTGTSCVDCDHFDMIRTKLHSMENHHQPDTNLIYLNSYSRAICIPQDEEEEKCKRSRDLSCQKCTYFKEIRQKLFNLEASGVVAMMDRLTGGASLTWHPAWEPPQDDKPKLLHVWGYTQVQFVHAKYDTAIEDWVWFAPETLSTAGLSPVAWADLPAVPKDILDAYTEDEHFKRTKKRYTRPKVRTMGNE